MGSESRPRRVRLSCNRALVVDSCHYARRIPLFPIERQLDLARLAELRTRAPRRVSWSVLFLKGFALVAARHAALRQTFFRWPWPHLYEHPLSVATLAISRQYLGEERLCWGVFSAPERASLAELQERLDRYQSDPVEKAFRRQVQLSRMPGPLRAIGWRLSLDFSGVKRAKRLGTFSMSSVAGQGAVNRFHPTILTSSLSYGPLDSAGRALVTLICDHRVLDGKLAATALQELETVLQTTVADELAASALRRAA